MKWRVSLRLGFWHHIERVANKKKASKRLFALMALISLTFTGSTRDISMDLARELALSGATDSFKTLTHLGI